MTAISAEWRTSLVRQTLVALGLAAGPVVALGFTRFAYALLLPPMHRELHWSYTQAGGMNTANALGYLLGAASAAFWARKGGGRAAFLWSLAVSGAALLATAATAELAALLVLRFAGGFSTAVAFVVGSALASRVAIGAPLRRSASLVAVYMVGVGIGVIISGLVVPAALSSGDAGWRTGWLLMGVLAVIALVPAWLGARAVPEANGPHAATLSAAQIRHLGPTFVWYVLFGAGYVSYMTFVIALLRSQGLGASTAALFFVVLGAASVVATLTVWGHLCGLLRAGHAPALVAALVFLGVLPVLLMPPGPGAALLSAVVFGAGFMAGPTAATVIARRMLPASGWTAGIRRWPAGRG